MQSKCQRFSLARLYSLWSYGLMTFVLRTTLFVKHRKEQFRHALRENNGSGLALSERISCKMMAMGLGNLAVPQ